MTRRIPFGLDRLPRSLAPDDPRLPGVTVGDTSLRLNTEPLPPEAMTLVIGDHAARIAAIRSFLHGLCGDYAPQRRRFVDAYLDALTAHIAAHRDVLVQDLQRYDGLYAPEDWLWSALRPLPRAWLRTDAGTLMADIAFWDGTQAIAIDLGGGQAMAGATVLRITPEMLAGDLLRLLPETFRHFWQGQILPASPFRRPIPLGVLAGSDPGGRAPQPPAAGS